MAHEPKLESLTGVSPLPDHLLLKFAGHNFLDESMTFLAPDFLNNNSGQAMQDVLAILLSPPTKYIVDGIDCTTKGKVVAHTRLQKCGGVSTVSYLHKQCMWFSFLY